MKIDINMNKQRRLAKYKMNMKIDLRKKINANKQTVTHVLHRFYHYINEDTGEIVEDIKVINKFLEEESIPYGDRTVHLTREDDSESNIFDIKKNIVFLNQIVNKYGHLYEKIKYDWVGDDGYIREVEIIGERIETGDELAERIKKNEKNIEEIEKQKELKKEQKLKDKMEKEKKLLEDLKSKYEEPKK